MSFLRSLVSVVNLGGIVHLKALWKEWNVQALVVVSFTIQLLLILAGPLRKQTSNGIVVVSIWVSYLVADWVAAQAIGLISRNPSQKCGSTATSSYDAEGDLFAFWAQFLLVHLGGPDSVTALALQDNELWLRTALHLGVQAYATLGVLFRYIEHSILWLATILMYFTGTIKYLERVSSLFYGCSTHSTDDPDHVLEEFHEYEPNWYDDVSASDEKQAPSNVEMDNPDHVLEKFHKCKPNCCYNDVSTSEEKKVPPNVEMVRDAFYFFNYYKGLLADYEFPFEKRQVSRCYFLKKNAEQAFKVLEFHFNFTYEAYYTKMSIVSKIFWKILRPTAMAFEAICLVIWCFSDKRNFHEHDTRITYALLIGAIAVDTHAILKVQFSYWNVARLKKHSRVRSWLYERLLFGTDKEAWIWPWCRRAFFRRWSESVSQLNLTNLLVNQWSKSTQKVIDLLGLKTLLDGLRYVTKETLSKDLRDFIFEDLKEKSKMMDNDADFASHICYAKGTWAPLRMKIPQENLKCISKVLDRNDEYIMILLRWHTITNFCLLVEGNTSEEDNSGNLCQRPKKQEEKNKYREICRTLSKYMIYLLLQQPAMMSAVIGTRKRRLGNIYDRTQEYYGKSVSEEVLIQGLGHVMETSKSQSKELLAAICSWLQLDGNSIDLMQWLNSIKRNTTTKQKIPEKLIFVIREEEQMINEETESAFWLRNILRELEALHGDKWKFLAHVWMELVCYAAIRCKPNAIMGQLKQGGELLSFVWLLMVQLGFGIYKDEIRNAKFETSYYTVLRRSYERRWCAGQPERKD